MLTLDVGEPFGNMWLNEELSASTWTVFFCLNEWQFLPVVLSLFIILVFLCLGSFWLGDDLNDMYTVHPLVSIFLLLSVIVPWNMRDRSKTPPYHDEQNKSKKEESSIVLEPPKRKPVKDKRKRRKMNDKDTKDFTKLDTPRHHTQTKIYSTLELYEKIKEQYLFDDKDLYQEFCNYVLTAEQLTKNDFPLDSPENPGKVIWRVKKFRQDPTSRICSRCSETFHISGDTYISDTQCHYHATRCDAGYHTCCNSPYGSEGCIQYPFHVTSEASLDDVIFKKIDAKRQVREDQSSKVYALDCEMVFTTNGLEVAKVGLVDLEGKTVYLTFVLPEYPVLDFNTQFSGVAPEDLKGVTMTLADVQNFLLRTLNKNTILVGHALQNDLRVLRLIHEKVVDTQVVFHSGNYRKKLKALVKEHLQKSIQESPQGHDSIEDARACMELMLFKIKSDLDVRPPMQDENKNSFLQNTLQQPHPLKNNSYNQNKLPKNMPPSRRYARFFPFDFSCNNSSLIYCENCSPRIPSRIPYLFMNRFCEKCRP